MTGGLGFIGASIALKLVELGASVRILDASVPGSGANPFNLHGVAGRLTLYCADIGDADAAGDAIQDCDLVFNLAGQLDHQLSMADPLQDLARNCESQLRFLECCRRSRQAPRMIFASTRQVYGVQRSLPVSEEQAPCPCDVNGIHKLTAEMYHRLYHQLAGVGATVLRLSNVYGPRMPLRREESTPVMARLVCKALAGEPLEIFGDGLQLRDVLYVEDAVDAFLAAGAAGGAAFEVLNVGGSEVATLRQLASAVLRATGGGSLHLTPFPGPRQSIDIGSIYLDCTRARRLLGWCPRVSLEEGLSRTVAFYRENGGHYWSPRLSSTISANTMSA